MNYEIQNLTQRLVSVHCNSGKTFHLPPGGTHEISEHEITGSASVEKLKDRKLIAVREASRSAAAKRSGTGSMKKSSRKKGSSKKKSQARK